MPSHAEEVIARLGLPWDMPHLQQALTHSSCANEQPGTADNERLEFLGDAVLGLCVSDLLMNRFPLADEGELSIRRASLINTRALAEWARSVELGAALHMGRGADIAGERNRCTVLADAVEAVVAAIYLDLGLERAREITRAIVAERLDKFGDAPMVQARDAKSELQEWLQAKGCGTPVYRVVSIHGPAHEQLFTVAVEVSGKVTATGRGRSKKIAQGRAARAALIALEAPAPLSDLTPQDPAAIAEPLLSSGEPQ